jgi:long-chain fatty acid transport protein
VANPSANILRCLFEANRDFCTGGAQAPGLGWNDVGVWKLGVAWQMNDALTLRAGASTGGNPVPDSDVTINIVAPAITEHHVTLGATYRFASGSALVVSYLRALPNSLTGRSAYNDLYPLNGVDTISLNIHNLGVAWRMPL